MIKKEKLAGKMDELIALEKRLIPLLNKHISSSLFFSNLKKSDRDKILAHFQDSVTTQTKHIETLANTKEDVLKGKANVY